MQKLDEKAVRSLQPPASGNRITYDSEVKGFGIRMTAAGAKAFVLNYRAAGRERRITIGNVPDWSVSGARDRAKELRRRIDVGEDPMGERHEDRAAPTIDDLAEQFDAEHLSRRRETTAKEYRSMLRGHILPALGRTRVADLRHSDVDRLHRKIMATAPYRANRAVAVLSKMMMLAIKWEMRDDNPVKGIERAPENRRERFLTPAEIASLGKALDAHSERTSCDAIRLLMLTGARRGETLSATWPQIDLVYGVWTKPSAATKQAKEHRIPLSKPAVALLAAMKAAAEPGCPYVFPGARSIDALGNVSWKPLKDIKRVWLALCVSAGLAERVGEADGRQRVTKNGDGAIPAWRATVRIHDLRHTYASVLAGAGFSLPIIGALLGQTQVATTARYAHLLDDPLRAATERVGAIVAKDSEDD